MGHERFLSTLIESENENSPSSTPLTSSVDSLILIYFPTCFTIPPCFTRTVGGLSSLVWPGSSYSLVFHVSEFYTFSDSRKSFSFVSTLCSTHSHRRNKINPGVKSLLWRFRGLLFSSFFFFSRLFDNFCVFVQCEGEGGKGPKTEYVSGERVGHVLGLLRHFLFSERWDYSHRGLRGLLLRPEDALSLFSLRIQGPFPCNSWLNVSRLVEVIGALNLSDSLRERWWVRFGVTEKVSLSKDYSVGVEGRRTLTTPLT